MRKIVKWVGLTVVVSGVGLSVSAREASIGSFDYSVRSSKAPDSIILSADPSSADVSATAAFVPPVWVSNAGATVANGDMIVPSPNPFPLYNQKDADDTDIYPTEPRGWANGRTNTGIRKDESCLAVVYAMIEHARGNTNYRVNDATWDDGRANDPNSGGPYPIPGAEDRENKPFSKRGVFSELQRGNPVILYTRDLSRFGHYILAIGVTANNQIIAHDPLGRRVTINPDTGRSSANYTISAYRVFNFKASGNWSTPPSTRPAASPSSSRPVQTNTRSSSPIRPRVPAQMSPGSTRPSSAAVVSSNRVGLTWSPVAGAETYNVRVRNMGNGQVAFRANVRTNRAFSTLDNGGSYRWDVRACNAAGCSQFSRPVYFSVGRPDPRALATPVRSTTPPPRTSQAAQPQPSRRAPGTPSRVTPGSTRSPGPGVAGPRVQMGWEQVTGAEYYEFGIRDMTSGNLVEDTRIRGTSFSANLMAGRVYRWNVAACNSAGCSPFTSPLYFRVQEQQSTPAPRVQLPSRPGSPSPGTARSPGERVDGTRVTIGWRAVSGATEYDFGIRDMMTNELVVDERTARTSFSARLRYDRTYRWNVRACNEAGCSSFTDPLYFSTPQRQSSSGSSSSSGSGSANGSSSSSNSGARAPSMPGSLSPGSSRSPGTTVPGTIVRIDWADVPGATMYDFGIRDMTTNQLVVDQQSSRSSYTTRLDPGHTYRWNVRACNNAGCSSFTSPIYFRTRD